MAGVAVGIAGTRLARIRAGGGTYKPRSRSISVTTAWQFADAIGLRPVIHTPSAQWLAGPFQLDASVANGAATDVDLSTQDAWFGDPSVRQAYSCVDAATTKLLGTVHIEAVQLIFHLGAFAGLDIDTQDN